MIGARASKRLLLRGLDGWRIFFYRNFLLVLFGNFSSEDVVHDKRQERDRSGDSLLRSSSTKSWESEFSKSTTTTSSNNEIRRLYTRNLSRLMIFRVTAGRKMLFNRLLVPTYSRLNVRLFIHFYYTSIYTGTFLLYHRTQRFYYIHFYYI